MKKNIYILTIAIFISSLFYSLLLFGLDAYHKVAADSKEFNFTTGCSETTDGSYTAIMDITASRDVYVKLGTPGQTMQVLVNQVNEDLVGGCTRIANIAVNGNSWTKVGALNPGTGRVVLEVMSPSLALVPDLSRPSVLLIDPANPICIPTKECDYVSSSSQKGFIRPPSSLNDKVSLRVGIPVDPSTDSLEKVDYFVEGKRQYATRTLESFDKRFASYSGQELLRVAHYKSGQEIAYVEVIPDGFNDSPAAIFYRTFNLRSDLSKVVFGIVSLIVFLFLFYWSLVLYVRRYHRLANHGYITNGGLRTRLAYGPEKTIERIDAFLDLIVIPRIIRSFRQNKALIRLMLVLWGVPLFVISSYLLTTSFVVNRYQVNGQSMTNTLSDEQPLYVNKIPQTIARITGGQVAIKRGDVVVADAVYGLTTKEQLAENQHIIVKRVVGLPGDRVVVKDGVMLLYEKDSRIAKKFDDNKPWSKSFIPDIPESNIDVTLGPNEVFVAGDNRPGSVDSRANGPIRYSQIIGKVLNDKQ